MSFSLDRFRVDPTAYLLPKLSGTVDAMMLFGSYARNDHSDGSDIDILQLSSRRRAAYKIGIINVSVYDYSSLNEMANKGSLFILHLVSEGKILFDASGKLQKIMTSYKPPISYKPVYEELRVLANLMDTSENEYLAAWRQYNDLGVFLLRTYLFARQAESGLPSFSIKNIVRERGETEILEHVALKNSDLPNWRKFVSLRQFISKMLNSKVYNPFLTPEAFVVNYCEKYPSVNAFGLRIIAKENIQTTYGLPMV